MSLTPSERKVNVADADGGRIGPPGLLEVIGDQAGAVGILDRDVQGPVVVHDISRWVVAGTSSSYTLPAARPLITMVNGFDFLEGVVQHVVQRDRVGHLTAVAAVDSDEIDGEIVVEIDLVLELLRDVRVVRRVPPVFQSNQPGSTSPLADRSTRSGAAVAREAIETTRDRTSSLPRIVVLLQLKVHRFFGVIDCLRLLRRLQAQGRVAEETSVGLMSVSTVGRHEREEAVPVVQGDVHGGGCRRDAPRFSGTGRRRRRGPRIPRATPARASRQNRSSSCRTSPGRPGFWRRPGPPASPRDRT